MERLPRLTPLASLSLPGATTAEPGAPSRVRLTKGRAYRLSCDATVSVRASAGQPSSTDLQVQPEAPLVFVADVDEVTIAATTSADPTRAWLQEEP